MVFNATFNNISVLLYFQFPPHKEKKEIKETDDNYMWNMVVSGIKHYNYS
jgi:hypothetical protein